MNVIPFSSFLNQYRSQKDMNIRYSVYSHSRIVPKDRALCNNRNLFPCFQASMDATEADSFPVSHHQTIPAWYLSLANSIQSDVKYRLWNLVANGLISTDSNEPGKVLCNGTFVPANGKMSKNVVTLR